jgi:hypothetical protein
VCAHEPAGVRARHHRTARAESGLYDTVIRIDSQLITKQPIFFRTGTGIATGEAVLARNLNGFDAFFFFGVREIELTPEQRADLLWFAKEDGKGFVAAHSAATGFFSWPAFGEMLGGRFDEHPWGVTDATVVVDILNRSTNAVEHTDRVLLTRHVQDRVGPLRWLLKRHDGLWGGQDHELDVPSRGLALHVWHDGQVPIGSCADDEPVTLPRNLLVDGQRRVPEGGAEFLRGLFAPGVDLAAIEDDIMFVEDTVDGDVTERELVDPHTGIRRSLCWLSSASPRHALREVLTETAP